MDAMFVTSTQPNEVNPFAPAPPDDPYIGLSTSTSTGKKKKGKKGALSKKKCVVDEPTVEGIPSALTEPEPEVPQMPEVPLMTMEDSPMEEAMPCPPESEPEPEIVTESAPPATNLSNEWDDWVTAPPIFKKKKKGKKAVAEVLPELQAEPPMEEPVAAQTPEIVVEPRPEEVVLNSDTTVQDAPRSRYTEPPIALCIGAEGIVHYVPRHLLPSSWIINESDKSFALPGIDLETGHTLVHYLYTGVYMELTIPMPDAGLKHALLVYIATTMPELSNLNHLATGQIQAYAENLNIFEILHAVKDDFARLEPDSWVHEFLRAKAVAAFEADHSVFRDEALLATLDSVVLGKVVMRWVVEMYDDKVSRMMKEVEQVMVIAKKNTEMLKEQMLVTPLVDECCAEQVSDHGSVETEEFCTISCPSEEGAEPRDDGVVVDEGDFAEPIGQFSHDFGETEVAAEEAVCEEAVCEEAVCEEAVCEEAVCEEAVCEEAVCEEAVCDDTIAAAEPVPDEEEPVVDLFARLSKSQRKLQEKMKIEAWHREEEEAAAVAEMEAQADEARLRDEEEAAAAAEVEAEEARLREEEEEAFAAAAAAASLEPEPVPDAGPRVCPSRAKHMIKEKRWMKCSSCRAAMQHMAVRLSRTNVDEETLQDLEKELVI